MEEKMNLVDASAPVNSIPDPKPKKVEKIKAPKGLGGFIPPRLRTVFTSKSQRGECKNNNCTNPRRNGSAYCQKCADKYNGQSK